MRRYRLYLLTACVTAALLGGCTVTSPEESSKNTSSEENVQEEAEAAPEKTQDQAAAEDDTASAAKTGEAEKDSQADEAAESSEEESKETETDGMDESKGNIILPEVAEGRVIALQPDDESSQEVVNVNFELVTEDNQVHAAITGINSRDEVVWQNVTPDFEAGGTSPLTGLTILADSYFYVENGDIVRINKETGEEYWRNTEFGGKVTDLGWAQLGEEFYFTGTEGPELFIMSMHGQTIAVKDSFNYLFTEPYRLRLEGGRIILNYEKTPTGTPALISVDPGDYSYAVIVDAEDMPTITDTTVYFANVETSLALRSGPGKEFENISALEPEEEMYVLKVAGDYAYVWVKETGMVGYATGRYVVVDDGTYRNALEVAEEAAESTEAAAEGTAESTEAAAEGAAESTAEAAEGSAEAAEGTAESTAEAAESTAESTEEAAEGTAESAAETAEDGEIWYVDVASSLYLREKPDYESDSVMSLEPLTEVILLGYEDGLAHVRVKATGEEGYVAPKFITNDLDDLNYA